MNLTYIERNFKRQQELLGNLADEATFLMIFSLIEHCRELRKDNDKLTLLNRHYYNTFYHGNIEKMEEDFKYLIRD